jgi:two-component system CheB/CheR fusion protein
VEHRHSDFEQALERTDSPSATRTGLLAWLVGGKGKRLNSIPVRFALMSAILSSVSFLAAFTFLSTGARQVSAASMIAMAIALVALCAAVTFVTASRLTKSVRSLQASAQAIACGDLSPPVEVDCAGEIGGLADSFRRMVARLNRDIVRMKLLAYSDPVTQLPNRAVVAHALKVMCEGNCPANVMFIDLDGFKHVNDTLGHESGDEVLMQVADRILEGGLAITRRETDSCITPFGELSPDCPSAPVFARFAGDEFVAILPGDLKRAKLEEYARRILDALARPFAVREAEVRLSASIGIARAPRDTSDPEQLLGFADLAMYSAKEAGKARIRFFDEGLRHIVLARAGIETGLREAIASGRIELHYQPTVDARSHALQGVEALVRWNHPQQGVIAPPIFIGIAESRGLMPLMGEIVLHLAARQARAWVDAGDPLPIAINMSASQFDRPDFAAETLEIWQGYRVDPSLLEIEITERLVMADFAGARSRLQQLREAGVRISIDDFGTGHFNLSELAELPFDVLKIDRSLLAGIGYDAKAESIIGAIVHMAKALGHELVAEGIETAEQRDFLVALGCDRLQGHLFGSAMPLAELAAWRRQRSASPVRDLIEGARAGVVIGAGQRL